MGGQAWRRPGEAHDPGGEAGSVPSVAVSVPLSLSLVCACFVLCWLVGMSVLTGLFFSLSAHCSLSILDCHLSPSLTPPSPLSLSPPGSFPHFVQCTVASSWRCDPAPPWCSVLLVFIMMLTVNGKCCQRPLFLSGRKHGDLLGLGVGAAPAPRFWASGREPVGSSWVPYTSGWVLLP